MTPRTLFDKVWDAHVVQELPGGWVLLHIDRHLLHDLSGTAGLRKLAARGLPVRNPELACATPDHAVASSPGRTGTTWAGGAKLYEGLRLLTRQAGIALHDLGQPGQGIVHVIGPELGLVQPGLTVICGDSHTCTNGALGAIAFGVGSSEVTHALATQTLMLRKPSTLRVTIEGALQPGVTAKDVALHVVQRLGAAGGTGCAVEYAGTAVDAMDIEARMTLCNLSIELGARVGMVAPDAKTLAYLEGREHAPRGDAWTRAVAHWKTLPSDPGAHCDREVTIDASAIPPTITWGTSPEQTLPIDGRIPDPQAAPDAAKRQEWQAALDYMGLAAGAPIAGTRIDRVFIGSCTNSRLSDLRAGRCAARPPRRGPCRRLGRAGLRERQACCRGRGPARALRGRRLRMARTGLQHVRRRQRRPGAAGPARGVHLQPQLRRPPGARRAHPPREPGRGGRRRHRRCDRRPEKALRCSPFAP